MIEVRDISRRFGQLVALDHASFRVEPGEIVALLGPNGAGKTTASRIIAGILAPSSGDVIVDGTSVTAEPNVVRERCGFVTDQPSLYDRMPLRDYLEFFARLYRVTDPVKRSKELAVMLGLADRLDTRLAGFSRGMKQKVAIARGLVHDPPVLLLDEPATALDPETARSLRSFIVSLRARHRAILLCTHDLDEAQRIADRVIIIDRGKIVREGPTSELRSAGRPSFTATVVCDAPVALRALEIAGIRVDRSSEADGRLELHWTVDDPAEANTRGLQALIAAGAKVVSLEAEQRSLEEAYLSIVQESRR